MDNKIGDAGLIFMKVGLHAQEDIEDIVKRKQREFEQAGSIFWGYGGTTCHPLTMVQPFAREIEETGNEVLIVMHKMNSKHSAPPVVAKEYSDDGVNWQPIPEGIEVRGSRCALVLDELRIDDFEIDLSDLEVGIGPSRGRRADRYLIGRADKGCFRYSPRTTLVAPDERVTKRIGLVARAKAPFAVFVRN